MADKVVHFEVHGKDAAKLRAFYSSLFGWKIDINNPMQYGIVSAEPGGIGGGIAQAQQGPMVTFYVAVEEPAKALAQVKKLGGKTLMEPQQIPGGPLIAMFADPEGNTIGLLKAENR
jgi:uncharacterized protein